MKQLTEGSLFAGIGGWTLACERSGVKSLWASEIEKFPISVMERHFPDVKQLGDINGIDGAKIEPVDIMTAGSPCQDLSIAGKREGLEGKRSGLFRKAIDIFFEMRRATGGQKPRWFIWENVCGAFISNGGMDFKEVLQEITKTEVPMPHSGRWAEAGMVRSQICECAWRVLDAQYWGVPQRRKRIFLVADFGGHSAGKILFKPESVSGHTEAVKGEKEGASARSSGSTGNAGSGIVLDIRPPGGVPRLYNEISPTLNVGQGGQRQPCVMDKSSCLTPWDQQSNRVYNANGKMGALSAREKSGMDRQAVFYASDSFAKYKGTNKAAILRASGGDYGGGSENLVKEIKAYSMDSLSSNSMKSSNPESGCREVEKSKCVDTAYPDPSKQQGGMAILEKPVYSISGNILNRDPKNGGNHLGVDKDVSFTLNTMDRHAICTPSYALQGNMIGRNDKAGPQGKGVIKDKCYTLNTIDRPAVYSPDKAQTLTARMDGSYAPDRGPDVVVTAETAGCLNARDYKGADNIYAEESKCPITQGRVRRLTPLECERLQGLPDNWTEGGSDAARYKAIGNGMA